MNERICSGDSINNWAVTVINCEWSNITQSNDFVCKAPVLLCSLPNKLFVDWFISIPQADLKKLLRHSWSDKSALRVFIRERITQVLQCSRLPLGDWIIILHSSKSFPIIFSSWWWNLKPISLMSPEVPLTNIFHLLTERKGPGRLTSTEHAKREIKQTILPKFKTAPLWYVGSERQRRSITSPSEAL